MPRKMVLHGVPPSSLCVDNFCSHYKANKEPYQNKSSFQNTLSVTKSDEFIESFKKLHLNQSIKRWPKEYNLNENDHCVSFSTYVKGDSHGIPYESEFSKLDKNKAECHVDSYNAQRQTCTWPARKALLMDIEFLNQYIDKESTQKTLVLYAHISDMGSYALLRELFSRRCEFFCIENMATMSELQIQRALSEFRSKTFAARKEGQRSLFISNCPRDQHDNDGVATQMYEQKQHHDYVAADFSFLRLRFPYATSRNKQFMYLEGRIMLPLWGRHSSTETKLVAKHESREIPYDLTDFESKMYFHNKISRRSMFCSSIFEDTPGVSEVLMDPTHEYCNCYDCVREVYILCDYTNKFEEDTHVSDNIRQLFNRINVALLQNQTIHQGNKKNIGQSIW